MQAFRLIIPTSWATTIAESQDKCNQLQNHIRPKTRWKDNFCGRQGLWSGKDDRHQECEVHSPAIQCRDRSHPVESCWYRPHCKSALDRDLWYHFESADAVQEGIVHLLDRVWTWVEGNWHGRAPDNHWTAFNTFQISKEASILFAIYQSQFGKWVLTTNFNTDISEQLHIGNVKQVYRSTTKVNHIRQMVKHNDRCTRLDYMGETLSHLALQGWCDIDSAIVFTLLSTTDTRRNNCRAHLLCLQHCQEEPLFLPGSQQVQHLRETHVCGVCRSIKLTSLREESEDFRIPNCGQLFLAQNEGDRGHEVCGLVLGYDQNALIDCLFNPLQNGLLYYHEPCHCSTSVERLGLDCKIEYTNANQRIMPKSHIIGVQYTESGLDNTFQSCVHCFPLLLLSWTPPNQILQFLELLPPGIRI